MVDPTLDVSSLQIGQTFPTSMVTMSAFDPEDVKERELLEGRIGLMIEGKGGWEHFKRIVDAAFTQSDGELILEVTIPDQDGIAVLIRR